MVVYIRSQYYFVSRVIILYLICKRKLSQRDNKRVTEIGSTGCGSHTRTLYLTDMSDR